MCADLRAIRRRSENVKFVLPLGALALTGAFVGLSLALAGVGSVHNHRTRTGSLAASPRQGRARQAPGPPYAVGIETVRLVEPGRVIELPNGTREPRTLVTYVRYPALGGARAVDVQGAPPARASGPFPLVVFGHGFAVTPGLYARMLQSWARAGFVVAAPVFPLENADAPGGPDESDLPNQPEDMRFVISRMIEADRSPSGPLSGLLDGSQVAVAGQSDGGDTALAVGYNRYFRDPRVKAVVVLSGAAMPGVEGLELARGGPPLLATQGLSDTVNLPSETQAFFEAARPPKYLLTLPGAEHLPPYSYEQPQLGVVERATTAFLDAYLERRPRALEALATAGRVPGVAEMTARP
jgi:dienelactone hydrolase